MVGKDDEKKSIHRRSPQTSSFPKNNMTKIMSICTLNPKKT
jgi:hypothetical protein